MSFTSKTPPQFFYNAIQTSPYSNVGYYDPQYGPWKEWFAWYPVKKYHWVEDKQGTITIQDTVETWVWWTKINRRKVIDLVDGPGREAGFRKKSWEYATLMDLLKNGH